MSQINIAACARLIVCVCVCVFVCDRESVCERECVDFMSKNEQSNLCSMSCVREKERERERVCVCVCACFVFQNGPRTLLNDSCV